jgi:hypothetical protein
MYALLSFILLFIVVVIRSKKEIESNPIKFFGSFFGILLTFAIGLIILMKVMSFWFYLEETLSPTAMILIVSCSIFLGIPLLIFLLIKFLIWWGKRK